MKMTTPPKGSFRAAMVPAFNVHHLHAALRDYSGTLRSILFRLLPLRSVNVPLTEGQNSVEAPEIPAWGD